MLFTLAPYGQGYQDSNLELTESESVALPFGDIPSRRCDYIMLEPKCQ